MALDALTSHSYGAPTPPRKGIAVTQDTWPLTIQQRWLLDAEDAGRPRADNIWIATSLARGTRPEAVLGALRRATAAHGVLRAVIRDNRMELRDAAPAFTAVDVAAADLAPATTAHAATTFDRGAGPLWSARMVSSPTGDQVLSLAFDGLIADGIAAGTVLRALAAPETPDAPPQYGDFARWQAARFADCAGDAFAFWREALAGVAVNRPVPIPFCRDPHGALSGVVETRSLDAGGALAGAVTAAAARARTTPFVVLLSALYVLLAEVTAERDLSVRVRVHGRPPGHARTVGLFSDDVVLRLPGVAGDLATAVADLRARWAATATHQLVPYARVVACVEPDRLVRGHRPVEVCVRAPSLPQASGGAAAGAIPLDRTGPGDVPGLDVLLAAGTDALRVHVTYDVVRFAGDDVAALLDRYEATLRTGLGTV